MKTVKLSFSILNAWSQYREEDAVSYYLGKKLPTTPQIELGKAKHKLWGDYTFKNKVMHPELGEEKLISPIVEQKFQKIIPMGSEYQILLRGIPDLLDAPTVYEFKCGATPAAQYLDQLQADYYKLLIPELKVAIYKCFNPYTNMTETGIKYLSRYNAENALEHVITFGGEMIDYLAANNLIIDFKG